MKSRVISNKRKEEEEVKNINNFFVCERKSVVLEVIFKKITKLEVTSKYMEVLSARIFLAKKKSNKPLKYHP